MCSATAGPPSAWDPSDRRGGAWSRIRSAPWELARNPRADEMGRRRDLECCHFEGLESSRVPTSALLVDAKDGGWRAFKSGGHCSIAPGHVSCLRRTAKMRFVCPTERDFRPTRPVSLAVRLEPDINAHRPNVLASQPVHDTRRKGLLRPRRLDDPFALHAADHQSASPCRTPVSVANDKARCRLEISDPPRLAVRMANVSEVVHGQPR